MLAVIVGGLVVIAVAATGSDTSRFFGVTCIVLLKFG
jgi:hypothetical protein